MRVKLDNLHGSWCLEMRVGVYIDGYNLYYGGRSLCGDVDAALVISNDSDLRFPIQMALPHMRESVSCPPCSSFRKPLRGGAFAKTCLLRIASLDGLSHGLFRVADVFAAAAELDRPRAFFAGRTRTPSRPRSGAAVRVPDDSWRFGAGPARRSDRTAAEMLATRVVL